MITIDRKLLEEMRDNAMTGKTKRAADLADRFSNTAVAAGYAISTAACANIFLDIAKPGPKTIVILDEAQPASKKAKAALERL